MKKILSSDFAIFVSLFLILTNSPPLYAAPSPAQNEVNPISSDSIQTAETIPAQASELIISGIRLSSQTFSPSLGESITLSFQLTQPAKALVQFFDADWQLVREFMLDEPSAQSPSKVEWDGKDLDGNIVPDEAYFFTIEAYGYSGKLSFYDPSTFSGGKNITFPVLFDKTEQAIPYHLDQDARIVVRAGVKQGPMLKNIVNWKPRPKGNNKESWDGDDESKVLSAVAENDFTLVAEGITLPENSIITRGNHQYTYFTYKNTIVTERPQKKDRSKIDSNNTQSVALRSVQPRYKGVDISFRMKIPEAAQWNEDGIPIISGTLPLKIYIDDAVKRYVTEQRYEIICYVDNEFVTEQEEGYSPCTWLWNSHNTSNGEHVLTVNVATLTGNIASGSMKILVDN
nr:FlgD immunoglobulin-like domain containing protein [uncultured Desulfobulbus sp.]